MPEYHLFLSYARADDEPCGKRQIGWVTAFHDHLRERHRRYSGRPLEIFFDRHSILNDELWQKKILQGLRVSRLFLAFLSPSYLQSKYCRWEWEEYLRLEHTLARGEAGIKQIYFVRVPQLEQDTPVEEDLAAWLEDMRARNRHDSIDLRAWYAGGPDALLELDAAERLADLQDQPRSDDDSVLLDLAQRVEQLDRSIAARLDEAVLAELAPGSMDRSYMGFVGRASELRDLHKALSADRVGLIGALHGVGGQGKTALAVQYAYAYAGHYAAGGRWQLRCEGVTTLAEALAQLSGPELLDFELPEPPQGVTAAAASAHTVRAIMEILKRYTLGRLQTLVDARNERDDLHGPELSVEDLEPRMLLVLDNVDQPGLLSAEALAPLAAEPWLSILVTTRLDPWEVADPRAVAAIAVDDLPQGDAMALLRHWRVFENADEERAAREIVQRVGGFTLAVELIGAYLQKHDSVTYRGMLARLDAEGLCEADRLGDAQDTRVRAGGRARTIGLVTNATVETLPETARTALAAAAFMPASLVRTDWLRYVVAALHPELAPEKKRPGYPDPWREILRLLEGRRLLVGFGDADAARPTARLHRMIGAHVREGLDAERCDEIVQSLARTAYFAGYRFEQSVYYRRPAMLVDLPALAALASALADLERFDGLPTARMLISWLLRTCGDAELLHGSLESAGRYLRASHQHVLAFYTANPASAEAARDLAISQNMLGDFYLRRGAEGDLARAFAMYESSLDIHQQLFNAGPRAAEAARDLAISKGRLGDFYLRRGAEGDGEQALAMYKASHESAHGLFEASPDSAQATRDLSVIQNRLGHFYLRRRAAGDQERALAMYEASLGICQRLIDANRGNAEAARDLAVLKFDLGYFYLRRCAEGDHERALEMFKASHETAQRLFEANPESTQAAEDLAKATFKVIQTASATGDKGRAASARTFLLGHLNRMEAKGMESAVMKQIRDRLAG